MVSLTTEYALRAIVYLGSEHGTAKTTIVISHAIKAPVGYLAKVMQGLTRAHLVDSQRGMHGGFALIRDPAQMTIYDVVQAVDPILRIVTCPLNLEGHGSGLCLLHATLDLAMSQMETLFRATRISDLIVVAAGGTSQIEHSCSFPHNAPSTALLID